MSLVVVGLNHRTVPVELLERVKSWLNPGGRIIAAGRLDRRQIDPPSNHTLGKLLFRQHVL